MWQNCCMKTFMQLTLDSSVEESAHRSVWDVKSCGKNDIQNFRDANMLMWDLFCCLFFFTSVEKCLVTVRVFVDGKTNRSNFPPKNLRGFLGRNLLEKKKHWESQKMFNFLSPRSFFQMLHLTGRCQMKDCHMVDLLCWFLGSWTGGLQKVTGAFIRQLAFA